MRKLIRTKVNRFVVKEELNMMVTRPSWRRETGSTKTSTKELRMA
jgi:hypothetical protein